MHKINYDQLTDSQRQAVFHIDGPLLILAGPGSGKTRVITYRIAALIESGVRPDNICAITFTNKAADEMRQRASGLGASAGAHISTFHSLCVRILRRYADQACIRPNFSIYNTSEQGRCIKQAVKDCGFDSSNFSPTRMLSAISALKNNMEDVDSFSSEADDFFSKALAKIYEGYQKLLQENNALDFDDLLMKAAILLRDNADVRRQLSERFKYLLIDEYQDTNQAQYQIAKLIASAHSNICVTGDPDQSIYRWRGADIRNILAFETDCPEAVVVKLEENFRSTPNILAVADNLISSNTKRKAKRLIPTKPDGKDVEINIFEDARAEAMGVAQRIKDLVQSGTSPCNIAICYRINAMSRVLEEAFVQTQIPYQIVRGVEFYNRKEIRDMLAYLKILANPLDDISLLRIINTPARGIGKTTIERVRSYAALRNINFLEALKKANTIDSLGKGPKAKLAVFVNMVEQFKKDLENGVAPLMERVFAESGLAKSFSAGDDGGKSELANINELINTAVLYDKQAEQPSLIDYLQGISLFSDADAYDTSVDRVALMTLHAAKGLEFENIFIIGLEENLLPHERSSDDKDELEEERRLFFVGITRAESRLYISYARYRTIRGQTLRTIPSQFLYELGIDFSEPAAENEYSYDGSLETAYSDSYSQVEPLFVKDQLVRHKKFGLGRIQKYADMGENSIVEVRFNTGQTKELMVKYAGLEKI